MALKLNIGQKNGKTTQKDISDEQSKALNGKKIGDTVKGDKLGFPGYEFKITGGSDNAGFPMRRDVEGTSRKRVLVTKGVGFQGKRKGLRKRRMVAGNTVYDGTAQLNVKVEKEGKDPLDAAPEEPKEEASEGDAKEESKQESSGKEDSEDKGEPSEEEDDSEGDGEDESGSEASSDDSEEKDS